MQYNLLLLLGASIVSAQSALYAQCGGIGFTGSTTCVAGATCTYSSAYYSQCLPGSGGGSGGKTTTTLKTTTTTAKPAQTSTPSGGSGGVYKASFTEYGAGDSFGSGNCNTATSACGFYNNPGFNAAISQNFYGAGPGAGKGPGCGLCWRLTPQTDSSGNALSGAKSIVVKINNLCPASGNPLCSQSSQTSTNQYGAVVNFDTCKDDGASAALFGSSGAGLAIGTAQQVDCSQWSGSANIM